MAIPLVIGLATAGAGLYAWATRDSRSGVSSPTIPQLPPSIENPANSSLNLTTVAGYLILGGLVYYFGRRLLK